MKEHIYSDGDLVSDLIGYCYKNTDAAKRLYQSVIVEQNLDINLPDKKVHLSESQYREFVERFSAEVGMRLWESKRLKN